MTRIRIWPLFCLFALTLAGCAGVNTTSTPGRGESSQRAPVIERQTVTIPGGTPAFDREKHADDELLVYAKRFGELSAESQKKEWQLVSQELTKNRKDIFNRLKAAIIYAVPNSRLRDNTKALVYLTELLREKQLEDDLAAFVSLLKDFVEDRQRGDENSYKLNQRIRDEQHRAEELQQKLDALKNIDKTMIERGQNINK